MYIDCGKVCEQIFTAIIGGNKTKILCIVKPFNCAGSHVNTPFQKKREKSPRNYLYSCKVSLTLNNDFKQDGTLLDAGVFTLIERSIDFSLGSQPVCHRITAIEAAMFGMEIGGNGNLIVMLGCLAIDGSLFMQSFCSVYGMRHDAPPLKIS